MIRIILRVFIIVSAEKQAIEAQMKEWQNKRLQHYNEIAKLERELAKAQQEVCVANL